MSKSLEVYLGVSAEEEPTLVQRDTPDNNDVYVVKAGGLTFPMKLYNIIYLGDQKVSIGTYVFDVKELELEKISEMETYGYNPDEDLILKDVDAKLPDPFAKDAKRLGLFTEAVIIACLRFDKDIALPKSQHNKKMTIIRSLQNLEPGKDITVAKAIELLGYYGLDIKAILNPECIVQVK